MTTRTGGELAGLAVVTLTGGELLGHLRDAVLHTPSGRVTGFLVDGGGRLFARPRFLPSGQVQSLGADALTVTAADALAEDNPTRSDLDEIAARELEGRAVLSASGTVIGKVGDVLINTEALTVTALLLSTGLINNTLHGKPHLPFATIQAIGKDSLIVPDSYDPAAPESHER